MQSSNKQEWNQITPKFRNVIYSKHYRWKKCLISTPLKNEKKIMKHAQNRRCISSICEQSLGKVWIKKNENFWSYRLHKLGTPKMLRMDGQIGKMSRFNTTSKVRKNNETISQNKRCTSSMCEQSLCKVWIERNEYYWSYRLHKLGTP